MSKLDKKSERELFVELALKAAKESKAECDVTFAEAMFDAGFQQPQANIVNNSITTISGSKYNYTEQIGDSLMSYGFDTHKELADYAMGLREQRIARKQP